VRRSIMIALIALLALVVAAPMAVAARHDSPQQPPVPVEGSQRYSPNILEGVFWEVHMQHPA